MVKACEILKAINLKPRELDLMDGSPPCASFSVCGSKSSAWGKVKKYSDTKQRVDDLFFEYIRLLREIEPKVFVAENVKGLVSGQAKGYFLSILKELKDSGYRVEARVIDFVRLGVPQYRPRLIFIGVRKDLNMNPVFPKPEEHLVTLKEALDGLVPRVNQEAIDVSEDTKQIWHHTPIGKAPKDTAFNFRRNTWKKPSYTVVQSGGDEWIKNIMHPDECRKFYIDELKRICAFPDDFILTGTYEQQYERLGRAVPPLAMYKISKTIQTEILDKV
jgi:DNA (cytosine-5)-methyltransferase 1